MPAAQSALRSEINTALIDLRRNGDVMIKSCRACLPAAVVLLFLALQPVNAEDLAPPPPDKEYTVTLYQFSSKRHLGARRIHGDYYVVTTSTKTENADRWVLTQAYGGPFYTIRHLKSGRFLDAHEIVEKDFHAVTRPRQTFDDTQLWRIEKLLCCYIIRQESSGRFLDAHEVPERNYGVVTRPRQATPEAYQTQLWLIDSLSQTKR